MEKETIIFISGGNTFSSREKALEYYKNSEIDEKTYKSWKDWLAWTLEDKYDFIFPKFADRGNSDYEIWKIIFEKYLEKIENNNVIIVAHSLGTILILKYLSENVFQKNIKTLHLVAPIIADEFQPENDVEQTGTFTFDYQNISKLKDKFENLHLWHSEDDTICLIKNSEFILKNILEANFHKFTNRGHFFQSTFLELFDELRK